ncbi:MFS transporter [Burkholderia cenocepacia]|nr:MFS transporter [Burkholderia cenocepacia]MDS0803648.1 MFS transporter [Burkholderia cenocepacia]
MPRYRASPGSEALISTLIIGCAFFMEAADANIIVAALPSMGRDFGTDPVALKITVVSYVVSLGAFIPLCGWLADRFSARAVFRAAIGIFVFGSLICAISPSAPVFTFSRFVQGIGGALMVPVGRIIVVRSVPKHQLVRAMNYLSLAWYIGPIVAPLLGGFIATYLHWRVMFFINVPVGLMGLYLSARYLPSSNGPDPGPFDWLGAGLSALGVTLVLLGLSLVDSGIFADLTAWAMFAAGVCVVALYVLHAKRAEHAVLDLEFFESTTFRASVLGGALFRIGCGAVPFLLPLSLQIGLGMTAFQSGLITCASAFGSVFVRPFTALALRSLGFRDLMLYNAVLSGTATIACGMFMPGTARVTIWLVVFVGGFLSALQFASLNTLIYADVPADSVGRATSVGSVVQQVSLGLGVALSGVMLQLSRALHGHTAVSSSDFWVAFLVAGLLSFSSIPFIRRLSPNAGRDMVEAGKR